jgi:hypothetical protein
MVCINVQSTYGVGWGAVQRKVLAQVRVERVLKKIEILRGYRGLGLSSYLFLILYSSLHRLPLLLLAPAANT